MKKIIFVGHCILNTASKVIMFNEEEMAAEEKLRRQFVRKALSNDIQIIQLPCPEFTLYGPKRWGHVSEQFDNVFFRNHCGRILQPIIEQMLEYQNNSSEFQILGIVGIDGSPSCGVDFTCTGEKNFGCLSGRDHMIMDIIHETSLCRKRGIFFQVLEELLDANHLKDIPLVGLFAPEQDKCMNLIGK